MGDSCASEVTLFGPARGQDQSSPVRLRRTLLGLRRCPKVQVGRQVLEGREIRRAFVDPSQGGSECFEYSYHGPEGEGTCTYKVHGRDPVWPRTTRDEHYGHLINPPVDCAWTWILERSPAGPTAGSPVNGLTTSTCTCRARAASRIYIHRCPGIRRDVRAAHGRG